MLDVFEDGLHRAFVDHRAHVAVFRRVADGDFFHSGFELFEELVVHALVDDGSGAGGALLALEAECGLRDAFDGGVDIGVGVDDDGVLAAHFKDGALDPELTGSLRGGGLIDMQPHFAGAGKRDVSSFGMCHDGIAEAGAGAGAEVHHAFGHAGFFQQFNELGGDGGGVTGGLQDYGVAADDGSDHQAGHNSAGEIPGRNHRAHAQRNVGERIVLAGQLHRRLGFG